MTTTPALQPQQPAAPAPPEGFFRTLLNSSFDEVMTEAKNAVKNALAPYETALGAWVNDQPLARPIPCTLANVWWFIDVAPEFITAFTRRAMLLAIDVVVFLPFEWMLRLYTCGAAAAMLLPIPTIVIALPFTAWVKRAIPFHSLFSLPRDSSPARLADYLSPLVIVHLLANRFFPTTSVATYSPYVLTYVAVTSLLDFSFLRLLVNILALVKESSLLEEISGPRLRSGCCGGSGRVCQCAVEIEVLKRQLAETKAEQKRAD